MVACRSSLENIGKMNLVSVLEKTSPRVHTKLELVVFGVAKKLVKYVVHSSKRKKEKEEYLSSHKLPKLQSTSFGLKEF
jgi:hypothetical protein